MKKRENTTHENDTVEHKKNSSKKVSIYDLFADYKGGRFESELIDFGEDVGNENLEH